MSVGLRGRCRRVARVFLLENRVLEPKFRPWVALITFFPQILCHMNFRGSRFFVLLHGCWPPTLPSLHCSHVSPSKPWVRISISSMVRTGHIFFANLSHVNISSSRIFVFLRVSGLRGRLHALPHYFLLQNRAAKSNFRPWCAPIIFVHAFCVM